MADEKRDDAKCSGEDRLVVGPTLPDGSYSYVRHTAEHAIEVGAMRPHRDGEPLGSNSFHLEERGGGEYAVKPVFDGKAHKGPAQVSSEAYRDNWENIFGQRQAVGRA